MLCALPDLLDGAVAKASGTAGPRGAFFDSVSDRVTDALLLGGVAWHLSTTHPGRIAVLPLAVLGASMLISYERAKAESLGFDARGGLMERAERIIALGVGLLFDSLLIAGAVADARAHARHRRAALREGVAAGQRAEARAAGQPLAGPPRRPAHRAGLAPAGAHQPPLAARPPTARALRWSTSSPRCSSSAPGWRALVPSRSRRARATLLGRLAAGRCARTAGAHGRAQPPAGRPHAAGARACDRAVVATCSSRYARYWVESFRLPGTSAARTSTPASAHEGFEHIEAARDAGKGAIMALPHLGGWEWAGFWLTRVADIPVTAVVEQLEPPELFEWFVELRRSFGMEVVPLGPGGRHGHHPGAQGTTTSLALLCDRDLAGGGPEVEFFGERTTLPGGPGHAGPAHRRADPARRPSTSTVAQRHGVVLPAARHDAARARSGRTWPASPRTSPTPSRS